MTSEHNPVSIALLVVSCDRYADLWPTFFLAFRKFWPDCPFKTYLLSNTLDAPDSETTTIKVGPDISWSSNLLMALNNLEEDYVLIFLEDLFLIKQVDNRSINAVIQWISENNPNCLKLQRSEYLGESFDSMTFTIPTGSMYRASTVLTIWNRALLSDILDPKENPWEFENHGTERSDKHDKFYHTSATHLNVINGVIRGKWKHYAIYKLKQAGLKPNLHARKAMNLLNEIIYIFTITRSKIFKLTPSIHQRKIKTFVRTIFSHSLKSV